ncbi:MAG: hypothetical protein AAGA42_20460 [Actinomycetota bacterium]
MELIGRGRELADVRHRLQRRSLVTITGPGGIGKTRLARAAIDGSDRTVAVVDLTAVDHGAHVESALLDALGYGDLEMALSDSVRGPLLVVLDNCEHVLDATAGVVERLRESPADLVVLATSRSPLEVDGESIVALGPLTADVSVTRGDGDPSVAMLRASIADRGLDPASLDASSVEGICELLDGVPLAIEIAAARLASHSAAEVLAGLQRDARALERPRYRGRSSHRSVTEMVTSSLDLLQPGVAETFDQLGVLAGPFTRERASSVVGSDAVDAHLEELVHASLVMTETAGAAMRYRMLYPVRAVAIDRLRSSQRWDPTMDRVVDDTVARVVTIVAGASEGWDESPLSDLRALFVQIMAALDWTIERDSDGARGLALAAVLWGVVHQGHVVDIVRGAQRAVDRWPDAGAPWFADAMATLATARMLAGDVDEAVAVVEEALPFAESSAFAPATLRRCVAQAMQASGRIDDAIVVFRQAADAARRLGSTGFALEIDAHVGLLLATQNMDLGVETLDAVVAEATKTGATLNESYARVSRASVELGRDPRAALDLGSSALALARQLDFPAAVSQALYTVAAAELQLGDDRRSAKTLLELLSELTARRAVSDLRPVTGLAAVLAERAGRPSAASLAVTADASPLTMTAQLIDIGIDTVDRRRGRKLALDELLPLLRTELAATAGAPSVGSGDGDGARCRRVGEVWVIDWYGERTQLSASKGMADLAQLLAEPSKEFAAVDLMGAVVAGSSAVGGIDGQARKEYEARIIELQADIDEADAFNDVGRVEALQNEMDALVDQLTSAVGLGGRSRQSGTEAERARSAVTHRLRATIKRFDEHLPSLGAHLRSAVTTGTFCVYRPEPEVSWTVES